MIQRQLTAEDAHVLGSFSGQWRAAGWGAYAVCHTDLPYGDEFKFFGALFLPEHFDELLLEQHQSALEDFRSIHFTPYDRLVDRVPPAPPTALRYVTLLDSPNYVYGPTAEGVCMAAIVRANELYPNQVPKTTTELGRLAAVNFGHIE